MMSYTQDREDNELERLVVLARGGDREAKETLPIVERALAVLQDGRPARLVPVAEEAGLTATRWVPLGRFAPYKGVSNERCHFFLARGKRILSP